MNYENGYYFWTMKKPGACHRMQWVLSFVCLFSCFQVVAQSRVITGFIRDQHSHEPVPFASVSFKKSGIGKLADSSGTFSFSFHDWQPDNLEITSLG